MFESKYSKLLTGLLILGIIIIIGAITVVGINVIKNSTNKAQAENAVNDALNEINNNYNNKENNIRENVISNEVTPIIGVENVLVDDNNSNTNNTTKTYKGFPWVGTIEIPKTELKSPVLQDSSKNAIKVAVGIYDGPGLNEIGNTTIAGHNYRNGTFFSNNKNITEGDKIYITDFASGKKVTYIVYKTYITTPEDSSYLDRDTEGKREISLTTCTDDSKSRIIVLAKEQ